MIQNCTRCNVCHFNESHNEVRLAITTGHSTDVTNDFNVLLRVVIKTRSSKPEQQDESHTSLPYVADQGGKNLLMNVHTQAC